MSAGAVSVTGAAGAVSATGAAGAVGTVGLRGAMVLPSLVDVTRDTKPSVILGQTLAYIFFTNFPHYPHYDCITV